jgi:hypothetical protein
MPVFQFVTVLHAPRLIGFVGALADLVFEFEVFVVRWCGGNRWEEIHREKRKIRIEQPNLKGRCGAPDGSSSSAFST